MTFAPARDEMRERFTESLALLNHIRQNSPDDFAPLDSIQRIMRGLWIVSLYSAFERSANAVVEIALSHVISSESRTVDHIPSFHSVIHYRKIQAIKDSGWSNVIDKSISLFNSAFSEGAPDRFENPLADKLQNVDGNTLIWVSGIFGISEFTISHQDQGRLNNLRERRNSVAHGREAASEVGQRFTVSEMNSIYNVADQVSTAFLMAMESHCSLGGYLRVA